MARAEKDLKKVWVEDSGAVGLYVSGKITERELDHQRKFINEWMETARAKVEDYRFQASIQAEKKAVAGNIVRWVNKIGEGIDNLPPKDLREVLRLIVDEIVIDRDNCVTITMGIPTNELVSIEKYASPWPGRRSLPEGQKALSIPAGAGEAGRCPADIATPTL